MNYSMKIRSQDDMDKFILSHSGAGNIYYDEEMNFKPINWGEEYVCATSIGNHLTLERVKIELM